MKQQEHFQIEDPVKEPLATPQQPKLAEKKSKTWILFAILAGFGIGVGNYLVTLLSSQGIVALGYVGVVAVFALCIGRAVQLIKNKSTLGTFINYNKSNFYTPEGKFKSYNIIPLLGNGLTNLVNLSALTFAYQYALLAGINQGVILTLNSLASVYNIFIFYFIFKEKVNKIQIAGIIVMIGCVGLLSLNGSSKKSTSGDGGIAQREYALLSILCGLVSPLALSLKHIFIRYYKKGYNTWDMAIDGLILEYLLYAILAFQSFVIGNTPFTSYNLIMGAVASVFIITGKISIALAVANGIAGPAASLSSTQAIYATLLTTFVSKQSMSPYEIGGVILGITGASIISMGDIIITKLKTLF